MIEKHKTIIRLLSDGCYHSGSDLGSKLKLTRAAVWRLIGQLKKYSIEVEGKTNQGYRIPGGLELLNLNLITREISPENLSLLDKVEIFDEIDSTNLYLVEKIKSETKQTAATSGAANVCLAECQTAGKGRLGRSWFSPYARNIYVSLSWQFSNIAHDFANLSLAIAIATTHALNKYGIKKDLGLKWPNDILWHNRKLAGILIDIFGESHHIYNAVIGIGLNVDMPPKLGKKISQDWCDIKQILQVEPKRNEMCGMLIDSILEAILVYQKNGLDPFINLWNKLDVTYKKPVTVITPACKYSGIGAGINEHGHFLLKDQAGKISSFTCGEVSLRF